MGVCVIILIEPVWLCPLVEILLMTCDLAAPPASIGLILEASEILLNCQTIDSAVIFPER